MLISRKYHFYAAHRAHTLFGDKCIALHGHTYHVEVVLDFPRIDPNTGAAMLFKDIDAQVDPLVQTLDHSTLLCKTDPLLQCLSDFNDEQADSAKLKLCAFDFATTAENLSRWFFYTLLRTFGDRMVEVKIEETTSGYVSFSARDMQNEQYFAQQEAAKKAEKEAKKADKEVEKTVNEAREEQQEKKPKMKATKGGAKK